MEKTIRSLVLLMIITGTIFTACGPDVKDPVETEKVNTVEVKIGDTVEVKDVKEEKKPSGEPAATEPVKTEAKVVPSEPTVVVKTKYVDGAYTESGNYQSPAGSESVTVTVSVKDDVVQSVNVAANAVNETSRQIQELFISGVNQLVVGKKLDEVSVSGNVNGSSLAGTGFNNAVSSIKAGALR